MHVGLRQKKIVSLLNYYVFKKILNITNDTSNKSNHVS